MKRFSVALFMLLIILVAGHTDTLTQQKGGKVYWMSTVTVPLGKMRDYLSFAEKELIPLQEKHGYHFVAGWQTLIGDIEEVIVVAEFESADSYLTARGSLLGSAEYRAMGGTIDGLTRGIRTRMLTALPYIKMK